MTTYIIFEKDLKDEKDVWTVDKVKEFCSSQEISVIDIKDDLLQITAKLNEPVADTTYRYVPITDTISFVVEDDPALDDFIGSYPVKSSVEQVEEKAQELCL